MVRECEAMLLVEVGRECVPVSASVTETVVEAECEVEVADEVEVKDAVAGDETAVAIAVEDVVDVNARGDVDVVVAGLCVSELGTRPEPKGSNMRARVQHGARQPASSDAPGVRRAKDDTRAAVESEWTRTNEPSAKTVSRRSRYKDWRQRLPTIGKGCLPRRTCQCRRTVPRVRGRSWSGHGVSRRGGRGEDGTRTTSIVANVLEEPEDGLSLTDGHREVRL